MDITGARWGDLDDDLAYHARCELDRNYLTQLPRAWLVDLLREAA